MKILLKKISFLFFTIEFLWLFCFILQTETSGVWPVETPLEQSWKEAIWFIGIWCLFSLLFQKFSSFSKSFLPGVLNLLLANLFSFLSLFLLGTIPGIELISYLELAKLAAQLSTGEVLIFFFFLNVESWLSQNAFPDSETIEKYLKQSEDVQVFPVHLEQNRRTEIFKEYKFLLRRQYGQEAFEYLSRHFNFSHPKQLVCDVRKHEELPNRQEVLCERILSMELINNFRRINKFFEAINSRLLLGGIFICVMVPQQVMIKRIFAKWPPVVSAIVFGWYFLFKRIFPKLKGTRGLYFHLTGGRKRSVSKVEALGRLYSCGFKLIEEYSIDDFTFFVVRKVKEPVFDMNPSYGPVFKMRRVGLNGKPICVYKLRTMYPYSEYLQEYLFERNHLRKGGKIDNDIRITPMGRILRRCWLDELPNLLNFIKGDMKLFGVRPLSRHYLSLYAEDLQELRKKVKPGLIPPFYADLPGSLEEIQDSERRYIESYLKNPWSTDLQYLSAALKNIFIKRAFSH